MLSKKIGEENIFYGLEIMPEKIYQQKF